ncbi:MULTISPECIES: recombinase family protein [Acetobacter]|jgi:putative DNA-invertase from lambdoid prophage Rac|uniref:recombinase family protein n=1 Tax=Acetobacter TaxID=434 RepID=UPI00376FAD8E
MAIYGYARVSTDDQKHDGQTDELAAAGVGPDRIVSEKVSGGVRAAARPGLSGLLDRLTEGDTLTVTKLDRLGRDAPDTLSLIRDLRGRGVGVRILGLGADTTGPAGNLILGVLASVAEWERSVISERTKDGLAAARRRGRIGGRRHALSPSARAEVITAHQAGQSVSEIARRYRVDRSTIYRALSASMSD